MVRFGLVLLLVCSLLFLSAGACFAEFVAVWSNSSQVLSISGNISEDTNLSVGVNGGMVEVNGGAVTISNGPVSAGSVVLVAIDFDAFACVDVDLGDVTVSSFSSLTGTYLNCGSASLTFDDSEVMDHVVGNFSLAHTSSGTDVVWRVGADGAGELYKSDHVAFTFDGFDTLYGNGNSLSITGAALTVKRWNTNYVEVLDAPGGSMICYVYHVNHFIADTNYDCVWAGASDCHVDQSGSGYDNYFGEAVYSFSGFNKLLSESGPGMLYATNADFCWHLFSGSSGQLRSLSDTPVLSFEGFTTFYADSNYYNRVEASADNLLWYLNYGAMAPSLTISGFTNDSAYMYNNIDEYRAYGSNQTLHGSGMLSCQLTSSYCGSIFTLEYERSKLLDFSGFETFSYDPYNIGQVECFEPNVEWHLYTNGLLVLTNAPGYDAGFTNPMHFIDYRMWYGATNNSTISFYTDDVHLRRYDERSGEVMNIANSNGYSIHFYDFTGFQAMTSGSSRIEFIGGDIDLYLNDDQSGAMVFTQLMQGDPVSNSFWNFRDFDGAYFNNCYLVDFNAVAHYPCTNYVRISTASQPPEEYLYQIDSVRDFYGSEYYNLAMKITTETNLYCVIQNPSRATVNFRSPFGFLEELCSFSPVQSITVTQQLDTYEVQLEYVILDLTWDLSDDQSGLITYDGSNPVYEGDPIAFNGFNTFKGAGSILKMNMFESDVYLSSSLCGRVYAHVGSMTNWLCSFIDFGNIEFDEAYDHNRLHGLTNSTTIWDLYGVGWGHVSNTSLLFGVVQSVIGFKNANELIGHDDDVLSINCNSYEPYWFLEGIDQGRIEDGPTGSKTEWIRFCNIPDIKGSFEDDWFVLLPGGGLSGSLDGEGGINKFDYSGYGQLYDIDLVNWTATGIAGGITNIFGYDITTTVQGPGSVFPYNPKVYEGFDITIDIDPDPDYHLAELEIDSSPVAVTDSYTFTNVTMSRTLLAVIEPDMVTNDTPAWWLHEYYPDTNDLDAAALSDTDDDDLEAWQEYIVGSDPTNAASTFVLQDDAVVPSGSDTVLSWASCSGRQYSVYYGTNLMNGLTLLPGADQLPATPPENSYTDTLHNVEQSLFYRIAVELAE